MPIRAFLNAYFHGLPQLFDVQVKDILFVDGIQTGQAKVLKMFIFTNAACISKWIIAIDQTYGISVNKCKHGDGNLRERIKIIINFVKSHNLRWLHNVEIFSIRTFGFN